MKELVATIPAGLLITFVVIGILSCFDSKWLSVFFLGGSLLLLLIKWFYILSE